MCLVFFIFLKSIKNLKLDLILFKVFVLTLTEKKFNCKVCHRSYSTKHNLSQHTKIHDESKAFKCDVCLKHFYQKSSLIKHYRTHTGEKPFACQFCDKKFAVKSNLTQHEATHSEIKSFKCSICPEGRFFKTKRDLNQHMVFHYEPKFACSHCDYKTHTKQSLDKHRKNHNLNKI